jgi:hypothetical protein
MPNRYIMPPGTRVTMGDTKDVSIVTDVFVGGKHIRPDKAAALRLDASLVMRRDQSWEKEPHLYRVYRSDGIEVGRHKIARWAWESAFYGVKARMAVAQGRETRKNRR